MPINKENIDKKKGIRFYWDCDPNDEWAEWVEVRILSPIESEEIDNKTKRFFKEKVQATKENGRIDKRSQIQVIEDWAWINKDSEKEHTKLRNALCIPAWCIYEEKDSGEFVPFPRTDENINYLLGHDPIFATFVFKCIASLADTEEVVRADLEKNLPASQKKSAKKSSAKSA